MRWLALLTQRSVWRQAHRHYQDAARYLDDSDPDWRRCYMRASINSTRLVRAIRRHCERR